MLALIGSRGFRVTQFTCTRQLKDIATNHNPIIVFFFCVSQHVTLPLLLLRAQRYLRLLCGGKPPHLSLAGGAPKRELLLHVGLTSWRCQTARLSPM